MSALELWTRLAIGVLVVGPVVVFVWFLHDAVALFRALKEPPSSQRRVASPIEAGPEAGEQPRAR